MTDHKHRLIQNKSGVFCFMCDEQVHMTIRSEFKPGDLVQFGRGTIPYEVVALVDGGRIITYDLICVGGLRKGLRRQSVPERKLYSYIRPGKV